MVDIPIWTLIFTAVAAGASAAAAIAAYKSTKLTARALAAELEPLFSVEICGEPIRLAEGELVPPPLQFRITNEGRSAAAIQALRREWSVCPWPDLPKPIDPSEKSTRRKTVHIPVGAGRQSSILRTRFTAKPIKAGDWVVFYGYIESRDLMGRVFVDGFCLLYSANQPEVGFHQALPEEAHGPERYLYHRRKN